MGKWADHSKDTSNSVHDMQTTHGKLHSRNAKILSFVVTVKLCTYCIIQSGLVVHVQAHSQDVQRAQSSHLGEALQSVEVTADFDIAVVTVPGKVVKLVHINAVAPIGHNVKQKALVIRWQRSIAGGLVVWTGSHNELLHALHVDVIESVVFDVTIIDDGLQDLTTHLLVTPEMYTDKHQYSDETRVAVAVWIACCALFLAACTKCKCVTTHCMQLPANRGIHLVRTREAAAKHVCWRPQYIVISRLSISEDAFDNDEMKKRPHTNSTMLPCLKHECWQRSACCMQ